MTKSGDIIDIFVNIVDNYGDMGFVYEFIQAYKAAYKNEFRFIIWTNNVMKMREFFHRAGRLDIEIIDIIDFGYSRKSLLSISLLHAPIPDLDLFHERALILRIDYLSLDPSWLENNRKEHILSTVDRQIIELIPSPLDNSAGLIPIVARLSDNIIEKHIVIFAYGDTLDRIDWGSFPEDIQIFIFGKVDSKKGKIILLDFLPFDEFYSLLDTSEFVIIRGEVTFAHMIQTRVPFFWNMYSDIGGFPIEQSRQFLSMMCASAAYRDIHAILNGQKIGKIRYGEFVLAHSHTRLSLSHIHNLIHTVKNYIDRFNLSI